MITYCISTLRNITYRKVLFVFLTSLVVNLVKMPISLEPPLLHKMQNCKEDSVSLCIFGN